METGRRGITILIFYFQLKFVPQNVKNHANLHLVDLTLIVRCEVTALLVRAYQIILELHLIVDQNV